MKEYDFVIVGAGLSGLTSHHELQKKGYSVVTLEASAMIGGRVRTENLSGGFSDTGAQFFTFNYPHINELLKELGLTGHPASALLGIRDKKNDFVLDTKNPVKTLASGILSASSWFTLLTHIMSLKWKARGVHPEDPVALAKFDDGDARSYCLKHLNQEIYERIMVPYFSAFNYAFPAELSGALVVRALLHMASGKPLMGLPGGLATFVRALSRDKEILTNVKVLKVSEGMVETSAGVFRGRKIIIATTASAARNILREKFPSDIDRSFSPSRHEALRLRKRSRDRSYGTLITPERNAGINVITNEAEKSPGLAPEGSDLFGVLCSREGALPNRSQGMEALLGINEDEILERKTTVWTEAIPVLPPGHFRTIKRVREDLRADSGLYLAGDYLSTGCSEGAVESGAFIASIFPPKPV